MEPRSTRRRGENLCVQVLRPTTPISDDTASRCFTSHVIITSGNSVVLTLSIATASRARLTCGSGKDEVPGMCDLGVQATRHTLPRHGLKLKEDITQKRCFNCGHTLLSTISSESLCAVFRFLSAGTPDIFLPNRSP